MKILKWKRSVDSVFHLPFTPATQDAELERQKSKNQLLPYSDQRSVRTRYEGSWKIRVE